MLRKSAVAAALYFITASPHSYALGLGDIDMQSALNQPMAAVIDLTSAAGTDLSTLKVSLASKQDHARLGLSRNALLGDFKFRVERGSNGKAVIRVSSASAVREPFLEFLLQLEWPKGRLLRQYTVLVDPPVTMPAMPAAPAAPVSRRAAPVTAAPVAAPVRQPARPAAIASPPRTVRVAPPAPAADSYGPIRRSQTLWDVAKRARPDEGVTMEQMMMALQRANPKAFMGNNINRLMAGVTLKIPERSEIVSMSPREAKAETDRQNAEWKARGSAVAEAVPQTAEAEPAAETTGIAPQAAETVVATETRLQLTAPEDDAVEGAAMPGDPEAATDASTGDASMSQQLALATEEAEAGRAQAAELRSRVDDLEKQIQTMKRLLELKDDELASLQQLNTEVTETETIAMAEEASPPATEEAGSDAAPAAADTSATQGAREIINRLMDNPVLAGLGALVAIVLGGILWASTRRKNNQGLFDDEMTFQDHIEGTAEGDSAGTAPAFEVNEHVRHEPAEETMHDSGSGDPLTEADVYLAYGRVQQAEDVLQAALQHHPDDDAIRLKLLEVYHDAGNVAAFNSMAGDFRETVTEDDSRWIRVAELGHALAPDNELYLAATPDPGGGLDFDVDLSGLEDLGGGQPPEELSIKDIPEQRDVVAATPGEVEFNLDESLSGDVVFDEEDNAEGLLENSDEVTTKLDLARAYIDMGDPDGAHSILKEVIEEGSDEQIHEAEAIISQLA